MWNQFEKLISNLPPFAWNLLLGASALLAGLIVKWILALFVRSSCRHVEGFSLFRSILQLLGKPVNFFLPLLVFDLVLPFMELNSKYYNILNKVTGILLILSFAAILIGIVKVV